jgi:hypothetical protein
LQRDIKFDVIVSTIRLRKTTTKKIDTNTVEGKKKKYILDVVAGVHPSGPAASAVPDFSKLHT